MLLAVINNQLLQLDADLTGDDIDEENSDFRQLPLLASLLRKAEIEGKLPERAHRPGSSGRRVTALMARQQRCTTPKKRIKLGAVTRS